MTLVSIIKRLTVQNTENFCLNLLQTEYQSCLIFSCQASNDFDVLISKGGNLLLPGKTVGEWQKIRFACRMHHFQCLTFLIKGSVAGVKERPFIVLEPMPVSTDSNEHVRECVTHIHAILERWQMKVKRHTLKQAFLTCTGSFLYIQEPLARGFPPAF